MKKLLFLSICIIVFSYCSAQSLIPTVVSSQGDYFTSSGGSVSWTLGEIIGETYSSANNKLTQGFQQPKLLLTAVENTNSSISISIYPNPTSASVMIEFNDSAPIAMGTKLQMYDVHGNMVLESPIINSNPDGYRGVIDLRTLADGMYVANIINSENNTKQSYKITKSK